MWLQTTEARKVGTRLTVGGDKLTYDEDATAPSSQKTEAKLLFNSVISDQLHSKRYGTAFLVQPQAKSRVAGCYFMGSKIVRNGVQNKCDAPLLFLLSV